MKKKRLLIPSAGGPGSVNMCRSLGVVDDVELIGFDSSEYYLFLALTQERYLCPRRTSEDDWVAFVLGLAERCGADGILPNTSPDGELFVRKAADCTLRRFLPSVGAFSVGEDKWESWQRFSRAGLPVPRTWLLSKREDVADVFDILSPDTVWVRGAGIPGKGIGVASLPCRTVQQAIHWVEYHRGWGAMIASEFLPGANLTWLGVFDHGRLVASQGRQRDAYVIPHVSPSGITGAPAISHTVSRADINGLGPAAVRAVDPEYTGPAFVDFKEDGQGVPRITEVNVGRLGTTHHFYTAAGANFPELLVRLMFCERLPGWVREENVLPAGLYWVRTLDAGPVLVKAEDIDDLRRTGQIGAVPGV